MTAFLRKNGQLLSEHCEIINKHQLYQHDMSNFNLRTTSLLLYVPFENDLTPAHLRRLQFGEEVSSGVFLASEVKQRLSYLSHQLAFVVFVLFEFKFSQ